MFSFTLTPLSSNSKQLWGGALIFIFKSKTDMYFGLGAKFEMSLCLPKQFFLIKNIVYFKTLLVLLKNLVEILQL